jgi:hypothetical protein
MLNKKQWAVILGIWMLGSGVLFGQVDNPTIWVQSSDRQEILDKIANYEWAGSLFAKMKERADGVVAEHQADTEAFLRGLPLTGGDATTYPAIPKVTNSSTESVVRTPLMEYLQLGIECGILYFLTENEAYAQCAADISATIVGALSEVPINTSGTNSGWIFSYDHLKEARVIGAQVPVLHDFIASYVEAGNMIYDIRTGELGPYPLDLAQEAFITYATLAVERGSSGNNWAVLESPSLVQNALVIEDNTKREEMLGYFLTVNAARQDPLSTMATKIANNVMWPETMQYANTVSKFLTILMAVMDRNDPSLDLFDQYPEVPLSIARESFLKYPNGEYILFGDGPRSASARQFVNEVAYVLAEMGGDLEMRDFFGAAIQKGLNEGTYARDNLPGFQAGATAYFEPLRLLWFSGDIVSSEEDLDYKPVSDHIPYAGIHILRNLSGEDQEVNSLMGFIGGGSFTHGHASGMNIELYGMGEVLGAKGGRKDYTTDIHENYYRLFAGHNTVVVNGLSGSKNGWVNMGINRVQTVAIEPAPLEMAVSPNHSFVTTSFRDDRQAGTEADQERTLAILRTSPTTGYYVDVFRSKSDLPDSFHDYIYHNIGDSMTLETGGSAASYTADLDRYADSGNLPWNQNSRYRHPGWHWFSSVRTTAALNADAKAVFKATRLDVPAEMHLTMPAMTTREFTYAKAPSSYESPFPYTALTTPTLVVRQEGDAWDQPFAGVYEPCAPGADTVTEVLAIKKDNAFVGLKITSTPPQGEIVQYVLMQESVNDIYADPVSGIGLIGRFGVITVDAAGELLSLYLGDGQSISYGDTTLEAGVDGSGYFDTTLPAELWRGLPVVITDGYRWVDTGDWLGWLEITNAPFVYCDNTGNWLYLPEDDELSVGDWIYFFKN